MDNWTPNYHEWTPGEWEQRLPESRDDFKPENRLKRVERLAQEIRSGAPRSHCRAFVYTEEEWRSGSRMAETDQGWMARRERAEPEAKAFAVDDKIPF